MKYIKYFESNSSLIVYHGTDLYTENGEDFKIPLWVSTDYGLATHFAIYPASSSKKLERGYVYKLQIDNPIYDVIDKRRTILKSGIIKILTIETLIPNPRTFTQVIDKKVLKA